MNEINGQERKAIGVLVPKQEHRIAHFWEGQKLIKFKFLIQLTLFEILCNITLLNLTIHHLSKGRSDRFCLESQIPGRFMIESYITEAFL